MYSWLTKYSIFWAIHLGGHKPHIFLTFLTCTVISHLPNYQRLCILMQCIPMALKHNSFQLFCSNKNSPQKNILPAGIHIILGLTVYRWMHFNDYISTVRQDPVHFIPFILKKCWWIMEQSITVPQISGLHCSSGQRNSECRLYPQ